MEKMFLYINPCPAETWTYPAFANSVNPDQLPSEEANWSGSALFAIQYLINNLDQIIWLAQNWEWVWHLNLFSRTRVKRWPFNVHGYSVFSGSLSSIACCRILECYCEMKMRLVLKSWQMYNMLCLNQSLRCDLQCQKGRYSPVWIV